MILGSAPIASAPIGSGKQGLSIIGAVVSKVLGAMTVSSTSTVAISGTSSTTLSPTTAASNSGIAVRGAVSSSLSASTISAQGGIVIVSQATPALSPVAVSSIMLGYIAQMVSTLGAATASAVAHMPVAGSVLSSLGSLGISTQSAVALTATKVKALGATIARVYLKSYRRRRRVTFIRTLIG